MVDVDSVTLEAGGHEPDGRFCVMELAAYIANEPWSDHPACVSPVLGAFLRSWNDSLDDDTRQRLKPYAERVIGTAGDGRDEERAWLATDWLVRVCAPAFLDLAGLAVEARSLRKLAPLDGSDAAKLAQPTINKARAAAWDAAGAAARDAAGAAAGDAAWAAAWDAAGAAAEDAAGAAAGAAARAAAGDKLQPTVTELQATAFDLLDQMIGEKAA
jgi:hypothetical protein